MQKEHLIGKTVLAVFVTLLFDFMAGAAVVIGKLEGAAVPLVQSLFIWAASGAAVLFFCVRKKSLSELGFRKTRSGSLKEIYYAAPLLVIALSALLAGIGIHEVKLALAKLFLAIAVGFAEEIYFRGILCGIWKKRGAKTAVLVSSILFGMAHLMNIANGADLGYTLCQMAFAFLDGVALALIFLITESLWPCIFLHFFHDLCTFSGNNMPSPMLETLLLAGWLVILLVYIFLMAKKLRAKDKL
jgi:membrane protease YdiL (CAAX protease family)